LTIQTGIKGEGLGLWLRSLPLPLAFFPHPILKRSANISANLTRVGLRVRVRVRVGVRARIGVRLGTRLGLVIKRVGIR
jgi:hypothetical protein